MLMVRPKKAQPDQDAEHLAQPQTDHPASEGLSGNETPPTASAAAEAPPAGEAPQDGRAAWSTRIVGIWTDVEAGVHLREDQTNRRMTIQFDEKPQEGVRRLLKEEHGYRFDGENKLWYKRINPAAARQYRDEAEQLAFEAANLVRQERGLEQKSSFSLGV